MIQQLLPNLAGPDSAARRRLPAQVVLLSRVHSTRVWLIVVTVQSAGALAGPQRAGERRPPACSMKSRADSCTLAAGDRELILHSFLSRELSRRVYVYF